MELRKGKEREFHNLMRENEGRLDATRSNKKFYSITRQSKAFMTDWLLSRCRNKKVLDYGCGAGFLTILAAKGGADAVGIDISDISVENGQKEAARSGVTGNAQFKVMDCEALEFEDNSFDLIVVSGVLHHLDLGKAFEEMARVLKGDGAIICNEGLADNPLLRIYRRRTPHLRTEWEAEHIMRVRDLKLAKRYFGRVDARFYHLFTIAAVPFRNTRIFRRLLSLLEAIDSVVLKMPFIRSQAWQTIFVLSQPNKELFKQDRRN